MKTHQEKRQEMAIPKAIENQLNEKIADLNENPPITQEVLFVKLNEISKLLEEIKENSLTTFIFKAKTLEWLLQISLQFKQNLSSPHDERLNFLVIGITETMLINIKAAMIVTFGLDRLPEILPVEIRNLFTPLMLSAHLEKKFNTYFDFYVTKKDQNNRDSRMRYFEFFAREAKQLIGERNPAPEVEEALVNHSILQIG